MSEFTKAFEKPPRPTLSKIYHVDQYKNLYGNELEAPLRPSVEDHSKEAECLTCRDAGWLIHNVPMGHDLWGKAYPCPDCTGKEFEKARTQRLLGLSGIPEARKVSNLAAFRRLPGTEEAFDAATRMALGQVPWNILSLFGVTGCGKTHLAYAVGLEYLQRGRTVKFWYLLELFRSLREQFRSETEDILGQIDRADLVILDDLGSEQGTEWQATILESIVNSRWANRRDLIITSNRDRSVFSPPIRSRLEDRETSRIVVNKAGDYRQLKRTL